MNFQSSSISVTRRGPGSLTPLNLFETGSSVQPSITERFHSGAGRREATPKRRYYWWQTIEQLRFGRIFSIREVIANGKRGQTHPALDCHPLQTTIGRAIGHDLRKTLCNFHPSIPIGFCFPRRIVQCQEVLTCRIKDRDFTHAMTGKRLLADLDPCT